MSSSDDDFFDAEEDLQIETEEVSEAPIDSITIDEEQDRVNDQMMVQQREMEEAEREREFEESRLRIEAEEKAKQEREEIRLSKEEQLRKMEEKETRREEEEASVAENPTFKITPSPDVESVVEKPAEQEQEASPAAVLPSFVQKPVPGEPSPHVQEEPEEPEEYELIVKNLDTGEMVKISETDVRRGDLDPVSSHLLSKLPNPSPTDHDDYDSDDDEPKKKKDGFFRRVFRSKEMPVQEKNLPPHHVHVTAHHRNTAEFNRLSMVQNVQGHVGAIWAASFNTEGTLLATGGQDMVVRVWKLYQAQDDAQQNDISETLLSAQEDPTAGRISIEKRRSNEGFRNSQDGRRPYRLSGEFKRELETNASHDRGTIPPQIPVELTLNAHGQPDPYLSPVFSTRAFRTFYGHTSEILDLAWSKNELLLSSSMDQTVRLWHTSTDDCLCTFQHNDFVTSVAFHPLQDRLFLSGCLDFRLREWRLDDKKIEHWVDIANFITAASFSPNGEVAVCGTLQGKCSIYDTDGLRFKHSIDVRSARGKNKIGQKVTGVEVSPNSKTVLVSSNDSRIRLYSLENYQQIQKFKGHVNRESQIRAMFSDDGKYVISGSENQQTFIWSVENKYGQTGSRFMPKSMSSQRSDHNTSFECFKANQSSVTCARFAPKGTCEHNPFASQVLQQPNPAPTISENNAYGRVIVTADFNGAIRVFRNVPPGHGLKEGPAFRVDDV